MLFYNSINKFIILRVKLLKVKVCCYEFLSENTGIVQGGGGGLTRLRFFVDLTVCQNMTKIIEILSKDNKTPQSTVIRSQNE